MARKTKDFSATAASVIAEAGTPQIEELTLTADADGEYTDEQKAVAMATHQTQGRKGMKMYRIGMAFTPDNYAFLQVMARAQGKSLTRMLNDIIAQFTAENADIYAKAKELCDIMDARFGTPPRKD